MEAPCTAQEKEVYYSLNRQEKEVNELNKMIAELSARLVPVINQKAVEAGKASTPSPILCELADRIEKNTSIVENSKTLVLTLLNHLEI